MLLQLSKVALAGELLAKPKRILKLDM